MLPAAAPFLRKCLVLVLKPAVRYCLRHSLKIQDLIESCKICFIRVAGEELARRGEKANVSRLSVMTGMHRRDVMRYGRDEGFSSTSRNLVTKVLGLWQTGARYRTKSGSPRVLSCAGESSDFFELVREVSRDLNPSTVLFELERTKTVKRVPQGIKLVLPSYVPKGNAEALFDIMGDDLTDLGVAVEENVFAARNVKNLHARTTFDRIRSDKIPEIKQWLLREGHALHARTRNFLSQFDQDVNPDSSVRGKTAKVVLTSFARVEEDETNK